MQEESFAQNARTTTALGRFNKTVPVYATDDGKHYMVDVQLGWGSNTSEPQIARLIIDTGSGDTVVFGEFHCTAKKDAFNHEVEPVVGGKSGGCFDYRHSASFKFNVEGKQTQHLPTRCIGWYMTWSLAGG